MTLQVPLQMRECCFSLSTQHMQLAIEQYLHTSLASHGLLHSMKCRHSPLHVPRARHSPVWHVLRPFQMGSYQICYSSANDAARAPSTAQCLHALPVLMNSYYSPESQSAVFPGITVGRTMCRVSMARGCHNTFTACSLLAPSAMHMLTKEKKMLILICLRC